MTDSKSNLPPAFISEVVYSLPFEGDIVSDQAYGLGNRKFDVYYPAEAQDHYSVVVFILGFPAPGFQGAFGIELKELPFYQSWAKLIAASGIAAVLYTAEDAEPDSLDLVNFLQENHQALKINKNRIGLCSVSANVPNALNVLREAENIRCASLNYGYMLDLDGATGVQDMASQIHFANPNQGDSTISPIPQLITKAGQDGFPGINQSIDNYVRHARDRGLDVVLIDYEQGEHSFDVLDDSQESVAIVQRILEFFSRHLLQ